MTATSDPVLSRIERSRALFAKFEGTRDDDAGELAYYEWLPAFEKMIATTPQTTVGAVALIDAFLETEDCQSAPPVIPLLNTLRRFLEQRQ